MTFRVVVAVGLGFALVTGALRADAEPKDAQAEATLKAIEDDYLETKFDAAEQKLRDAIESCGQSQCSAATKAKLYAGLAAVLAGGKHAIGDAKDAFIEGLKLDKTVKPIADLSTSEVEFAFSQAKKELKLDATPATPTPPPLAPKEVEKPKPNEVEKPRAAPIVECIDDGGCSSGVRCVDGKCNASAPPSEDKSAKKNWVSIAFEPDIVIVGGSNVCTVASQADNHTTCVRANGSRYVGTPTLDNGDNVNTGFAIGTLRFVLGYDRVIQNNFTIGGRVGFAFNGATDGGASFLPIHVELRAAVWPGVDPFARLGVRPYFMAAAGIEEVDAKVDVEVLEDGKTCGAVDTNGLGQCTKTSQDGVIEARKQTLSAYKQAGQGFGSLGFGFVLAPVKSAAFDVGVRASALFPSFAFALTPEVGFALGF